MIRSVGLVEPKTFFISEVGFEYFVDVKCLGAFLIEGSFKFNDHSIKKINDNEYLIKIVNDCFE